MSWGSKITLSLFYEWFCFGLLCGTLSSWWSWFSYLCTLTCSLLYIVKIRRTTIYDMKGSYMYFHLKIKSLFNRNIYSRTKIFFSFLNSDQDGRVKKGERGGSKEERMGRRKKYISHRSKFELYARFFFPPKVIFQILIPV